MPTNLRLRFYRLLLGTVAITGLAASTGAQDLGAIPKSAQIAILRDPGTAPVGANHADVMMVEYFDYNCPFCKKLMPALDGLLKQDSRLALVYKDWPILSAVSVYAARSALAAGWQGKYLRAHDTLMHATHLATDAQVDNLLSAAGIDLPRLKADAKTHAADIQKLLQRNDTEARALGIRGTPGLLVGGHLVNGVYDVSGLQQAVAAARAEPR